MAPKNKVSVSTDSQTYRPSANERRAARVAEIANKQSELKREAAERRAKRAKQIESANPPPKGKAAGARPSNSR
jgi:hypothetical protein